MKFLVKFTASVWCVDLIPVNVLGYFRFGLLGPYEFSAGVVQ
jgi:hypothetical protein